MIESARGQYYDQWSECLALTIKVICRDFLQFGHHSSQFFPDIRVQVIQVTLNQLERINDIILWFTCLLLLDSLTRLATFLCVYKSARRDLFEAIPLICAICT